MKHTVTLSRLIAIVAFVLFTQLSFAQVLKQVRLPQTGVEAAAGCLACPGSEWNMPQNISTNNNQFATTQMAAAGFCFQSTCAYSRGLMASDFNFNIPTNALIAGIKVKIERMADQQYAVRDSSVKLMNNLQPLGANKKSNAGWPTTAAIKNYGSSTDLWSAWWTPGIINGSGFGVWLQCYHASNTTTATGSVDFIKVIVYYSLLVNGEWQERSATATAQQIQFAPNPASSFVNLQFNISQSSEVIISVIDLMGREVLNLNEMADAGIFTKQLDVSSLPSGNYLVQCRTEREVWVGRISVIGQ